MRTTLLAFATAAISISLAAPLAKMAAVPGPVAAWWRLLIGSLATLTLSMHYHGIHFRRDVLPHALLGGGLLAAHFSLWFESLHYSSIASSTGIVVTYPAIAAAVEAVTGTTSLRTVLATAVTALGVALLSTPWAGATPRGSILAILAAAAAASYFLLGRRLRVHGLSTLEYTLLVYTSACAALSIYLIVRSVNPLFVPFDSIPFLVLLGLIPMLGGHTVMNYLLGHMPASRVTLVALVEPYGASLLGWALLGEKPSPAALPGLMVAVIGVWLSLREHVR